MEHFGLFFQMPTIKMFWPSLPQNFGIYWKLLEIIGHGEIIIQYYWNETFIAFVDCFMMIRTFVYRYTLIKVDCQDREQ